MKYVIDSDGMALLLDVFKSGRQRKIARLYYVNNMTIDDISRQLGCNTAIVASDILVINKTITDNLEVRQCGECGGEFYSGEKNRKCPICKEKAKKERLERQKNEFKLVKPVSPKKKKKIKTLQTIEKERAKYNKEHGTHLSYGYYVLVLGE